MTNFTRRAHTFVVKDRLLGWGGREGRREGGRAGGMEGGREGGWEGG